jgi:hypothetical protein
MLLADRHRGEADVEQRVLGNGRQVDRQ